MLQSRNSDKKVEKMDGVRLKLWIITRAILVSKGSKIGVRLSDLNGGKLKFVENWQFVSVEAII